MIYTLKNGRLLNSNKQFEFSKLKIYVSCVRVEKGPSVQMSAQFGGRYILKALENHRERCS